MRLLVVAAGVVPGAPLLIGANRDEQLARPATAMAVLRQTGPRILGGRDEQSGGTWLAVNSNGVFAALTNQPLADGRDPTRRTRGELPLALAARASAAEGAREVVAALRPADYNGCWLMVGDRHDLFFIDFTGRVAPQPVPLDAGIHVLENRPLGAPSPKADRVRRLLGGLEGDAAAATATLRRALADHGVPDDDGSPPPLPACVHLEGYGTRSSCLVTYADRGGPPRLDVADGPPCTAAFHDVSARWVAS